MTKEPKNVFRDGPIGTAFIADSIAKHSVKTSIGGHSIFLGQVRADVIGGTPVRAIEYTAYTEMANEEMHRIREEAFRKFELTCMHIYHSLGTVKAGEICLFVFTSSPHRAAACDACRWIVEEIKAKAPVWGKEILEDESSVWKKENQNFTAHG
ncbi:MAG: molybdenum cofactor biosynthesis protein MoaE [Bacteroidia bacterium]|nr:molybdenum cofactor biosynthesis protein MoaE [Bacteroidia bacterium]